MRRIAATLAVGIVLLIAMLAAIEAGIGWALRMPRLAMPQPSEVEVVQFSSREGAKMDAFVAETSNADEIAAFLNLIEAQNTGWKKTWLPFPGPDHRFMIHGPEGTLIVWLGKE